MIRTVGLIYEANGHGPRILNGIGLTVARGERVGLVGPSGAGKSTLGYHLCGVHTLALNGHSRGTLHLEGQDAIHGGPRGFGGMVLQNPETQLFCRTVGEEVALGLPVGSGEPGLGAILDRTGLQAIREQEIATLSLGWKQRVSISGMLAMAPKALLLDEPTNYLDGRAADALFDLLDDLGDTTVIVADHDERRLRNWADRIIRLEDGTVVLDVPAAGYLPSPPLERRTDPGSVGGILLAMEDLHFAYEKARPIFQGFSLDLREGEAVALLGSNGAGKTTLLRLAKGLLKPGSGRIRAASGRPLMREVGLVFQNPDDGLFAASVEDECAFLPRNLGLERPRDRARAVLARLGLAGMADQVPFTLSYGEKRRVSLASVLAGGARILCLDEPTAGLDRGNLEILAELLKEYAREGGGVLFATHDPAFAAAVATRTIRLDGGRRDP